MATLVSITYKPKSKEKDPADHFVRVPVEHAMLVENQGIEGDAKGGNPNRQLNIMTTSMLAGLAEEGFKTEPGEMGEQMIVDGIDLDTAPAGTLLQVGETALVEILKLRNGCDRFSHIQSKMRPDFQDRLGQMAKVVRGGSVRVGDPVKIVKPEEVYV